MGMLTFLKKAYFRLPIVRDIHALRRSMDHAFRQQNWLLASMLKEMLRQNSPRFDDRRRLLFAEAQCCSQNGEDGILRELFERIGTTNRIFLEIGCGDGSSNNTALLATAGWTGFWIDGSGSVADRFAMAPKLGAAIQFRQAFITAENIEQLCEEMAIPSSLDLLSIDIDQNTYHVWKAIQCLKPRAVVVEYNASVPAWLDWVCDYGPAKTFDSSINFGASLKAFERLGADKGYALVGCDTAGVNAYFVRADLVTPGRFCEPFTAENHYEPPRYAISANGGHLPSLLDLPDRAP